MWTLISTPPYIFMARLLSTGTALLLFLLLN
jgi:hypothetical protein